MDFRGLQLFYNWRELILAALARWLYTWEISSHIYASFMYFTLVCQRGSYAKGLAG